MKEHKTDDVRSSARIDLPTMQKYLNFHFSRVHGILSRYREIRQVAPWLTFSSATSIR